MKIVCVCIDWIMNKNPRTISSVLVGVGGVWNATEKTERMRKEAIAKDNSVWWQYSRQSDEKQGTNTMKIPTSNRRT